VAREGFLKDKCGPRAKTFEHHWSSVSVSKATDLETFNIAKKCYSKIYIIQRFFCCICR